MSKLLAVIRLRGSIKARKKVLDTLRMLGLTRVNHCVLVDENPSYAGMLREAKDMITWGEINRDTLVALIRKRGRLVGDERVTDDYVKEKTGFPSVDEFADAVLKGETSLRELPGLKKVFRLHPPRKGYRAIKRAVTDSGDLGYRGDGINELLSRMI